MDYERCFLSQLDAIDRIVRFVGRQYRLTPEEQEEFQSIVRLKLIDRDYEVLRRFEGRSSLGTYLTTVIQRIFLDHRIQRWGKWRPSAVARRQGDLAIRLERLLARDGLSFEEACEQLAVEQGGAVDHNTLDELRGQLSPRVPRRFVGEEALAELPVPGEWVDEPLHARERHALAKRLEGALSKLLARRPARDRLILQLRFKHGLSVADVGRALRLDPKPLYRRIEQLMHHLRRGLEAEGFSAGQVADVIGRVEVAVGGETATRRAALRLPGASLDEAQAAELYAMSREAWDTRTVEGIRRSIALAKAAAHCDGNHVLARSALALSYGTLASYTPSDPAVLMEKARAAAHDALLHSCTAPGDPSVHEAAPVGRPEADGEVSSAIFDTDVRGVSDAHTALGFVHLCFDRDWGGQRTSIHSHCN